MNLGDGKLKLLGTGLAALWFTLGWQGAPADAITVTPANPTIGVGQTQQFTANGALTPTAVAAGGFHACMRLPDGTVQCWGRNYSGQLGNGDGNLTNSSVPVTARGLTTATSVVTGDAHTCALLGDGTVQCWGLGGSGQRGDGTFNDISSVPVAVVGMGGAGHLTNAVAVAAGGYHSCALLGDGTVWCWGRNQDGQLGNGIPLPAPPGTQCPSSWCSSTPVRASGITGAAAVIAGGYHTCAVLMPDRTAQCWGRNDDGQLGDGTRTSSSTPVPVGGLTGAAAVTGGFYHTCALLGDGTVQCWGQNYEGQLGNGIVGGVSTTPVLVAGLANVRAVSGGYRHTCALLRDGTVQCWGRNVEGQLGGGATTSSSTPVGVGDITGAVAVGSGVLHTCALLLNGTVKCWGAVGSGNDFGQLGNGATTGSSTPVTVMGTGVVWTSSDPTVATIDASGRAAGLGAGTATITATDGSGASASTTLIVNPAPVAPTITAQPASQMVTAGQTASFSVTATGTAPLSYQWQRAGVPISGATLASYATPPTTSGDNGAQFTVVVSNTAGSVTSTVARLTVNSPPTITSQPVSRTVTAGQTASFSVTATGTAPLSYQWQRAGVPISGATLASYTTPSTTSGDNGAQFTVVVSNPAGSVTSSVATLTVNSQPTITTHRPTRTGSATLTS